MSRTSPSQQTFNAGELSPLLGARADMAKYGNGCYRLRNFKPLPQGPLRRREGSRYVQPTYDETQRAWLVRFQFSPTQSFIMEFGGGWIRFYAAGGAVLEGSKSISAITKANPAVVTSNAHGFTAGDTVYIEDAAGMTEVNGGPYVIGSVSTNTFALLGVNSSSFTTYTGSGTVARCYQIASPWSAADLTNDDGTFALSMEQTGDVIFIAGGGTYPQKLTRLGNTNWTLDDAAITDGPFIDVDPDETVTVYADAATGTVTLTASSSIFTAEKVGTLFRLEQKKIDAYKVWEVAKTIAAGDERRSDSNVYRALNSATTGSVKPTHRIGARFDGDTGVQWEYVHSGYGTCRITAVAGTTATATVIDELPSDSVSSGNASTRWAFSAWDDVLGYPTLCTIHRERLTFLRGTEVWASVPGDFENFADRDGAETLPDSALTMDIAGKDIADCVWVASADDLLIGNSACEVSLSPISSSDGFGPGNVKARTDTKRGSRAVPPVVVGGAVLFVQSTGRRLQNTNFNLNVDRYDAIDLTVLAEHIARGQIIQMAFAQEPHSIIWACCHDGSLIALTFMPEQDVLGWHQHDVGGGFVESVACIKDATGNFDQLWMVVRRTINGQTRRYVEYLGEEWEEDPDDPRHIMNARFSDCGATYDGEISGASITLSGSVWGANDHGSAAISSLPVRSRDVGDYLVARLGEEEVRLEVTSTPSGGSVTARWVNAIPVSMRGVVLTDLRWARNLIGGLSYLEGEEVTVLVEGASHPNCIVDGGEIELQRHYHHVEVGLPAPCDVITMRIEAGGDDGTAQGKIKRVTDCVLRLHQTIGGQAGAYLEHADDPDATLNDLQMRSSADAMNGPPAPLTGDIRVGWEAGYETDARLRYYNDQPFPVTIMALFPQLTVEAKAGSR